MFITKMALPRRTFLRGMGVTLALPLLDAMVPAASALAQTVAKPVSSPGLRLHSERGSHAVLAAGRRRDDPRRDAALPASARAVQRSGHSATRPQSETGGSAGRRQRRALARRDGVAERRAPEGDRGCRRAKRHDGRSDRRAAHRWRHPADIARARDGADVSHRELRQRLQLRLHETASRGGRRRPRIRTRRTHASSSSGCSAMAGRRKSGWRNCTRTAAFWIG